MDGQDYAGGAAFHARAPGLAAIGKTPQQLRERGEIEGASVFLAVIAGSLGLSIPELERHHRDGTLEAIWEAKREELTEGVKRKGRLF